MGPFFSKLAKLDKVDYIEKQLVFLDFASIRTKVYHAS